KKKRKRRRR
ncbi:UBN2 domain-containing protein, partial [Cephalotus follicularis]